MTAKFLINRLLSSIIVLALLGNILTEFVGMRRGVTPKVNKAVESDYKFDTVEI